MSPFKVFSDLSLRVSGSIETVGDYLEAATKLREVDASTENAGSAKNDIRFKAEKFHNLILLGLPRDADVIKTAKVLGFEV